MFSDFLYQSQLGVINHKIITAITARKILINVCKELEETTVMKSLKGLATAKMITCLCRQLLSVVSLKRTWNPQWNAFQESFIKSHVGNEHQFLYTFLFKSSSIPLSKMKYATTRVIFFSVVRNTWKMKYKAPILFM